MPDRPTGGGRGPRDWILAGEAAAWLALAALALRTLSFRQLAGVVSRRAGRASESRGDEAERVGWAVGAAAARAPWRALCFERGLAAHFMLRRRGLGPVLYYGARSDDLLGPTAHVWVRLDGRDVVGGEEAGRYAVLATFPAGATRD
jgi:hypothetical protein